MKKILFFTMLMFVSFFSVNASTSYVGWPHTEVSELPTATVDLIGYIYDYNGKYYVVNEVSAGLRNIQVGDNLLGKTLYFNFPEPESFCPNMSSTMTPVIKGSNTSAVYYSIYEVNGNSCMVSFVGRQHFYSYNNNYYTNLTSYDFVFISGIDFCQNSKECIVTEINTEAISYQYMKISGDTYYEWKEISYYDWYEYKQDNTDFYLFFTFTDISSFDIFENYDFNNFSDFEKVSVTLLFNIFFTIFIGLCIYIILKSINKLITWLF